MELLCAGSKVQLYILNMARILSTLIYCLVWVLSLLPLPFLYLFSDIIWLIMFVCPPLRYRKSIVRKNLALSFPEKDKKWAMRWHDTPSGELLPELTQVPIDEENNKWKEGYPKYQ